MQLRCSAYLVDDILVATFSEVSEIITIASGVKPK